MDQQIYVTLQFFAVEYISVDNVFYLGQIYIKLKELVLELHLLMVLFETNLVGNISTKGSKRAEYTFKFQYSI